MDFSESTLIHREYWQKRLVEIYDNGDSRSLYFGGKYLQSRMSISAPHTLSLAYTRYMMSVLPSVAEPARVLLIGLGAGSIVRFLHHHFPACLIDGVDHSAHIINLARGYFRLPESDHIRIHCQDGFSFLADHSTNAAYDLILVDAFDENGMSADIYSEPFFRLCAKAVKPAGVVCCNLWSGTKAVLAAVSKDISQYFAHRMYLPVPERGNIICNAMLHAPSRHILLLKKEELERLRNRYDLDFPKIAEVARKHNMGLAERMWWTLKNKLQP